MEALARFIATLGSEEIWALLDALFPGLDEGEKEDLHDMILASHFSGDDVAEGRPAEEVFAGLKKERGLAE